MNRRITRINDEIKAQVALLLPELKDHRLTTLITVVKADTTTDLKYCKVYVSIMGSDEEKKEGLAALKSASGFIKRELARGINLRQTPELTFVLDTSLDHAMRIDQLLKEIND